MRMYRNVAIVAAVASLALIPSASQAAPARPAHAALAAPTGARGTATAARLSWGEVLLNGRPVQRYRWQVRDGAGHVTQGVTQGLVAALSVTIALTGRGPHTWRVQAAGGAFTAWLPVS